MSKFAGNHAEDLAIRFLKSSGYDILDRNWKNRWCEIDVVATKNNCVSFIEVKYRNSHIWGRGVDYINQAKIAQMIKGAHLWCSNTNHDGQILLGCIELEGPNYKVSNFIENIIL